MTNEEKPPNGLNPEDREVWERYIDQEKLQKTEDFSALLDQEGALEPPSSDDPKETVRKQNKKEAETNRQPAQLDRKTEEKIRKGKMPIDARLDLHGLKQDEAHTALHHFIVSSQQQGLRCVLVITGKGKSMATSEEWLQEGTGILKKKVPEWLVSGTFKDIVLKSFPAQPKDGGSGALYVYLRRKR